MKEKTKYIELAFNNKQDEEHTLLFKSLYSHRGILLGAQRKKLEDIFEDGVKECRFCGKDENETTFKQVTHVIPQLLKRAKPVSNFECDECNQKFSKYETDFSNYYLLHRAMFGHTKKSSGLAKLKTKSGAEIQGLRKTKEDLKKLLDSDEEIEQFINSNHNMVRLLANDEDEEIEVSDNGKTFKITVVRPTYKPLNVYRTLLKIALSLIPQDEFGSYKAMLNILNGDFSDLDPNLFSFIQCSLPKYNSYFNIPMFNHWDRNDSSESYPQKIFALYIDNKIIQIPVFSDDDFDRIYSDKESYSIIAIPPILNPLVMIDDKVDIEFHKECSKLALHKINLSGIEKIKGEIDQVTIEADENLKTETKDLRILKSDLEEEALDEQRWGFLLKPEFNEYNKVDLKIIFDLLIPITESSHVYMKSGSFYQIENLNKESISNNLDFIEDLLASSMEHTYRMFLQKFPDLEHVKVRTFNKSHFREHIINQLAEKNLYINEQK